MEDTKYQGWANYETWNVKLWMDNDEGSYHHWKESAQEAYDSASGNSFRTREQRAADNLADTLKDEHAEMLPELDGFAGDLLTAAFGEVNWREIAASLLEDVDKEEEPEEEEAKA